MIYQWVKLPISDNDKQILYPPQLILAKIKANNNNKETNILINPIRKQIKNGE